MAKCLIGYMTKYGKFFKACLYQQKKTEILKYWEGYEETRTQGYED